MNVSCWCDTPHNWESSDPVEQLRNLGHLILTELHVPQLAEWLAKRIQKTRAQ